VRLRRGRPDRPPHRFHVRWKRATPYLVLVERRALREGIAVEAEPSRRSGPTGFWRGRDFYRIVKVLERRRERGESYLRVLADRGCFDLHHVTEIDPWTWQAQGRWELVAELQAIPIERRVS
jgi:hypothetical protein